MKAETAYQRLNIFLAYKKVKVGTLENKLGLTNARIAYILKRKASVDAEVVELISNKYPDLNKSWILWEEGEMLLKTEKPPSENTETDGGKYLINKQNTLHDITFLEMEVRHLKKELALADECNKQAQLTIRKMEKLEGSLGKQIELLEEKLNKV